MIDAMRDFILELVQSEQETHHRPIETKAEFEQFCADEEVRCTNAMWDLYQKYHMEGLDEIATEEVDEIIEEALSNKEKLKRAYPELNFDTPVAETLNEAVDPVDKMSTAVGILFDMDNFTLAVRDNSYWLAMGVPDGEFDENDRDLAEANYEEHQWLIEDDNGNFDAEAFRDLLDAFETATDDGDYDQNERARIIHEAEIILNMNESVDDMDKRCENCNTLLNDMGKCPKCDDGEEDLDEAVLNEAPDKLTKKLNKLNAKDDNLMLKRAQAVSTIIRKSIDPNYRYVVDGDVIDAATYRGKVDKVKNEILNSDKLLGLDPSSALYKEVKDVLDVVAIDKKGWIVRRGLELLKPGKMAYRADRADLLEIPNAASSQTFLGKQFTKKPNAGKNDSENQVNPDQAANNDAKSEVTADDAVDTGSNEKPDQENKKPDWITDESIKAAITLLAKRKNGSSEYYDKDGNLVDYKKITTENINDIFTDKEATKPFIAAMEGVKKGLANRKAAAIKSAALFGEGFEKANMEEGLKDFAKKLFHKNDKTKSKWGLVDNQYGRVVYTFDSKEDAEDAWKRKPQSQQFRFSVRELDESIDDSIQYDHIEEVELDEGLNKEEMISLMAMAKDLGINTIDELDEFSKREVGDGEDLFVAMKRYKGEVDGDIEPLEEVFSEDVINEEFTNYSAIRAQFEANNINYGQREAFENMLVKACKSLTIDPELALIYEDRDREFDPIYFADESKELQYNVLKLKVFDLDVVRIEFKGTIYIIFRSQADADIYMNYAH